MINSPRRASVLGSVVVGTVNLNDFNLMAANFGLSAAGPSVTPQDWSALAAAVPEPAGGLALGVAMALFGGRVRIRQGARVRRR